MRLIDADALIEEFEKQKQCMDYGNALWSKSEIESIIENAPIVEAKPVVHGSWETEFTAFLVVYRCSECNCATALGQTNFCPNCGCDMRGGKNE